MCFPASHLLMHERAGEESDGRQKETGRMKDVEEDEAEKCAERKLGKMRVNSRGKKREIIKQKRKRAAERNLDFFLLHV